MPVDFTIYVILLNRIPGKETPRDVVMAHIEFVENLDNAGTLVIAGPFKDYPGGMLVIRAESLESARTLAESDPFISGGYRTFEIRTWELARKENNYLR